MDKSLMFVSITELGESNDKYIIPIYQRNYSWTKNEVETLINDIVNSKPHKNRGYYIGSLVVFKRTSDEYEVIDGQQRLTTLKLILSALECKPNINLSFEHRESSNNSLNNLGKEINNNIDQRFKDILDIFNQNNINRDEFKLLLSFVQILRVEVPEHTDLNHYFEIMNNRGEQLEKHEIVKAYLMSLLPNEKDRQAFSNIWDVCSDMDSYVVMNFPSTIRERLLKTIPNKLHFHDDLSYGQDSYKEIGTILNNIDDQHFENEPKEDEQNISNEYKSVIDFPNFLMLVLKMYTRNNEISLDDKKLYEEFKSGFKKNECDVSQNVKGFIIFLLRIRLIFDRYIIKSNKTNKSENNKKKSWCLLGLKKGRNSYFYVNSFGKEMNNGIDENNIIDGQLLEKSDSKIQKDIVMLLSMFEVSFSINNYKNWLFDVLSLLDKTDGIENYSISAEKYMRDLESLANKYFKARLCLAKKDEWNEDLCLGTRFNHYIFNYLDYLLWKNDKVWKEEVSVFISRSEFEFSSNSNSVEHYFPQSRQDELEPLDNIDKKKIMNNFGNLCLIPSAQNSSLSNDDIIVKRSKYNIKAKKLACNSIKQAIMLSYENWGSKEIKEHCTEMINILYSECERYF